MESPNKNFKPVIASTCSDSAPVQDSPIFNFISNLSPIKPDKMAPVVQGFSDLSCPPPVFASPETSARRPSIDLKRPECHPSSHSESSGRDDIAKNISASADEFKKSTSHICSELEADIDKEHEIKNSAHDLAGSSSGCVNEYLDDISETGCGESTTLEDSILKESEDAPPKMAEPCAERLSSKVYKQNDGVEPDAALVIYNQEEKNSQGYFQSLVEPDKKDGENASNSLTSNICLTVVSAMPAGQATTEHDQTIGAEISNAPAMKMTLQDSKVSQSQLCMRRCLQFGEALRNIVANDPCSHSPSNGANCSRSPVSSANSDVTKSSGVDIPATPNNTQLDSMTPSTYPLFSPENNKNGSLIASKPSGIGLHLNSIVNVIPLTCDSTASIKSTEESYLSARGKQLTSVKTSHMSDISDYQSNSSNGKLVENASVNIEGCDYENPAYCPSSDSTKSLKLIECQELALCQGKANSRKIEIADRFNQSSTKKKRKKTENTSEGDGCKRCNCKKTKCLKLYCDCFAAGIYCAAPCACQGCFNKPEYDDTVSETRQQIESRNPFAFGPKIIHPSTQLPSSCSGENGDRLAQSSGRHKKGCNCKRSMCLKKYCECYQANVGCSDGCRCEGCKNIYGKKEDCRISRGIGNTEIMTENWDDSDDGKLKRLSAKSVLLPEFQNVHILTPQTPSFQYSNHGKDSSQARILSRRCIPSPESSSAVFPPYASMTKSPGDSSSHDMTLNKTKEIFNVVYSDQKSKANKEVTGEFSPGYHAFGDTGHLTTLANNPPAMNSASLALGKTSERGHSRAQFPPAGGQFSSMSTPQWRSSPVTPVDSFGLTKLHQLMDSDSRLGDIMEDDTPEVLKETPTPHNTVKVSSPNKKRVSPPKHHLHDFGSTSIKSGRKFILRSISSFPPLTSCVDPEDVNFPNINDAREQNSNK